MLWLCPPSVHSPRPVDDHPPSWSQPLVLAGSLCQFTKYRHLHWVIQVAISRRPSGPALCLKQPNQASKALAFATPSRRSPADQFSVLATFGCIRRIGWYYCCIRAVLKVSAHVRHRTKNTIRPMPRAAARSTTVGLQPSTQARSPAQGGV